MEAYQYANTLNGSLQFCHKQQVKFCFRHACTIHLVKFQLPPLLFCQFKKVFCKLLHQCARSAKKLPMAGTCSGNLPWSSRYLPFFFGHCIFLFVMVPTFTRASKECHRFAWTLESLSPATSNHMQFLIQTRQLHKLWLHGVPLILMTHQSFQDSGDLSLPCWVIFR